jgi:hypothetical protein
MNEEAGDTRELIRLLRQPSKDLILFVRPCGQGKRVQNVSEDRHRIDLCLLDESGYDPEKQNRLSVARHLEGRLTVQPFSV